MHFINLMNRGCARVTSYYNKNQFICMTLYDFNIKFALYIIQIVKFVLFTIQYFHI